MDRNALHLVDTRLISYTRKTAKNDTKSDLFHNIRQSLYTIYNTLKSQKLQLNSKRITANKLNHQTSNSKKEIIKHKFNQQSL